MNLARESIALLEQAASILCFEGTRHGLRDREWMALRFLTRANRFSRTPSALATYVGTTRGTASFIIGELERLGYLERRRSATDSKATAGFSCRLFRSPIAEAEVDLLCISFEHNRQ